MRRNCLLGKDLLLRLGKQMRTVSARAVQMMAAEVKTRSSQQLVRPRVVQRRPLELEEQQLCLELGARLLNTLQQRSALGIRRVCGEAKRGVGAGPPDVVLDFGELVHRTVEAVAIELGDLARISLGERARLLERRLQHLLDPGWTVATNQRIEVPLGFE